MRLIVGLGNPGPDYAPHRHNIGFMVADSICSKWYQYPTMHYGYVPDSLNVLIKPQTFMNTSGIPAARMAHSFYIEPANIIVVHDDLDLPLGTLRIKVGGSDGGHRGIRSIVEELSCKDFIRVRLGVGRPPEGTQIIDFVLSDFLPEEEETRNKLVDTGCKAVEMIISGGVMSAQNALNRTNILEGNTDVQTK